jgi:hypothetical protein
VRSKSGKRRKARRLARARAARAAALALLGGACAGPVRAAEAFFVDALAPLGLTPLAGGRSVPGFTDIDGDGDLDALFGGFDGDLVFFRNTGSATAPAFAAAQTNPFGLADADFDSHPTFADLDDDGDIDLLVGNEVGDTLFFRNTGSATAPAFATASTNPFGLADVGSECAPALGDFDGDGDLDLLVGEVGGNLLLIENTGTASAPAFAAPVSNAAGLANVGTIATPSVVDFQGDGDLDVMVGNGEGHLIAFLNDGSPTEPEWTRRPGIAADFSYSTSPAFADLDGDGDLDAVVGNLEGQALFFQAINEEPLLGIGLIYPVSPFGLVNVGDQRATPAFGDLDGDGDLDALYGRSGGDFVYFPNEGFSLGPMFGFAVTNPFGLAAAGNRNDPDLADIDGDGDLDIFAGDAEGDTIFFQNTGSPSAPAFAAGSTNPFGLAKAGDGARPAFADIDHDGDLDAFVGYSDGRTILSENTGSGSAPAFGPAVTGAFGLAAVEGFSASPALGDLDGDGDLDALVGDGYGNTVFFRNTGSQSDAAFAAPVTNALGFASLGSVHSLALADIDGDGDLDAFLGELYGSTRFLLDIALPAAPAPPPICPASFDLECFVFESGSFEVNETTPGKEKLTAKLTKGEAVGPFHFGDPTVTDGTAAALCVYAGQDELVAELHVDRAGEACGRKPCWRSLGKPAPDGKGFAYKDPAAAADGVKVLSLKGGPAGRSSIALRAANQAANGRTFLPTGIAAALATADEVRVQLHTSNARCFGRAFEEITRQEPLRFKAR